MARAQTMFSTTWWSYSRPTRSHTRYPTQTWEARERKSSTCIAPGEGAHAGRRSRASMARAWAREAARPRPTSRAGSDPRSSPAPKTSAAHAASVARLRSPSELMRLDACSSPSSSRKLSTPSLSTVRPVTSTAILSTTVSSTKRKSVTFLGLGVSTITSIFAGLGIRCDFAAGWLIASLAAVPASRTGASFRAPPGLLNEELGSTSTEYMCSLFHSALSISKCMSFLTLYEYADSPAPSTEDTRQTTKHIKSR
mmetsp:Transcript_43088/g.74709  ORF Transcript_43088/g.74709 Transcript_43088/m.74709 type:complete len:254 (+) Transcript_43088:1006-1767(+)